MNGRGTYGTAPIPLHCRDDGGLSPLPAVFLDGRGAYGQHAFHGHEAPTYGSGGYAPIDHATHWGLSWKPRLEIVGDASGRGTYGSGRWGEARMGNVIYHSVGDIEDAVKQLSIDYDAAYADIGNQVGILPYEGSGERVKKHPDWYLWWTVVASPQFKQFVAFRREMLGGDRTFGDAYIAYTNRMKVTSWSNEILSWHDKLVTLRKAAEHMGMSLVSPVPTRLATTLPEDVRDLAKRAAEKAAEGAGDAWTLVKYGLWGVLGIGAIVALSSVASNLRSGKDPAEKYVALAGRGARGAAEAAVL